MSLNFDIPSKGGGTTKISVEISPGDSPQLLQFMSAIDRQVTLEAMAEELRYQLCNKPG